MRYVNGRQLARVLGPWRESGARPVYTQLAAAIRLLVLDGRLALETRLPSERDLASSLEVSRTTVTAAYDALRADGFAASRQGSGTWTTLPDDQSLASMAAPLAPFAPFIESSHIDLAHASPQAPVAHLRAAYGHALNQAPRLLTGHGYHLLGLPELREAVARRFTARGLPTAPDQIMITAGSQHAFSLLINMAARPGHRVVIEHPTYPNALDAIRRADARVVPVSLDPDGWDLDAFAAAVRQSAPHLAYLVPDFHNPTGLLASTTERQQLAEILGRSHTLTVADETLVELGFTAPPLPLASHDGGIVTIGSASKTFWGGLRIGWIRAEQAVIRKLMAVRANVDIASPVLEQAAAAYLIEHIDDTLPGCRAELLHRRDALVALLAEHLPDWTVRVPEGGLVLWCDMGSYVSSKLTVVAEQHGVRLAAGPRFGVDGAFERYLRLPFTQPVEVLERAVVQLSRSYAAVRGGGRRALDAMPDVLT